MANNSNPWPPTLLPFLILPSSCRVRRKRGVWGKLGMLQLHSIRKTVCQLDVPPVGEANTFWVSLL